MTTRKEKKLGILKVLSENLKNPQPQAVSSLHLAEILHLSLTEIRQLLLIMNQAGEVESNQDGELALITAIGMQHLESGCPAN